MTILGPFLESFKTMNRPGPTVMLFGGLFLGKYERWNDEILKKSSFKFSICTFKI